MKMVKAVVRPEAADLVADSLSDIGFASCTKINAFGRGKQRGITVGQIHYDELPKTLLMMAVEDEDVETVIAVIEEKAFTGSFGDGKIFVAPVERVFTVRTGTEGL
ncbi:MAG: P-II family nitrogen regulator [Clostridiales bacterium]|jgi:nitrogen regulatory protein PII 1|nr:P-II family nitrogen regulator [Clostridiales bacterium]MDR2750891.1 P-II family nitrogen regulator [Clostridiales bacterium]